MSRRTKLLLLLVLVLWEISQMIIGGYMGVKVAVESMLNTNGGER